MSIDHRLAHATVTSILLLITPIISSAADLFITPRVGVGLQHYRFEQSSMILYEQYAHYLTPFVGSRLEPGTAFQSDTSLKTWMPTLNIGLNLVSAGFFADISVKGAYNGSDISTGHDSGTYGIIPMVYPPVSEPLSWLQRSAVYRSDTNLDRLDYAFSMGYKITENFSLFGGWKWGKTSFDSITTGSNADGLGAGELTSYYTGTSKFDFDQNGPFFGAAYNWKFDHGFPGILSITGSLAFLHGTFEKITQSPILVYDDFSSEYGTPLYETDAIHRYGFEGDTTGFTIGISWQGNTSVKRLSYLLGVNGYSQRFRADSLEDGEFAGTSGGHITETVLNLEAGLTYTF